MPLSKFSRRHRRTWEDEKPEQDIYLEEHRTPPKPPHYYDRVKGRCRMCGLGIYKDDKINKRSTWHPKCADEYMMIYHAGETRRRIWQRDKGQCAKCNNVQPRRSRIKHLKWHVDHIRPLYEQKGKRFDEIDLTYWHEENLQTLCFQCHADKSALEAKDRADKRAIEKEKIDKINDYNKKWVMTKLVNLLQTVTK